jgi:hypothetical protein
MDRATQSRRPRFDPNSTTQERPSAEIEHDSGAGHAEATSDRAPGSIKVALAGPNAVFSSRTPCTARDSEEDTSGQQEPCGDAICSHLVPTPVPTEARSRAGSSAVAAPRTPRRVVAGCIQARESPPARTRHARSLDRVVDPSSLLLHPRRERRWKADGVQRTPTCRPTELGVHASDTALSATVARC